MLRIFNGPLQFLAYSALLSNANGYHSSEESCSNHDKYFPCGDRTCISIAKVCDGVAHCRDGRDENRCRDQHTCITRSQPTSYYPCRKPCNEDSDCRGIKKRCVCDDECGKSCLNPNINCLDEPPAVEHAEEVNVKRIIRGRLRRVWMNYRFGDIVTYLCDRGYTLVGPNPRCNAKGKWSSEVPVCEDSSCRTAVPQIAHARGYHISRTSSGVTRTYLPNSEYVLINDTIMYVCEDGFDLEGTPPKCGQNLQFSNFTATCAVPCNHERDDDMITKYNLDCGAECYTSSDCGQEEECICVGPCSRVCVNSGVDCPLAPQSDNAQIRYDGSGLGRIARYRCKKGYFLSSGKLSLHCVSSGIWLGEPPTCTPVMCGSPYTSIERTGGYAIAANFSYGSVVMFGCDGNKELIGSKTRVCQENGLWSGQLAVCIEPGDRRRCPHPGIPINGRLIRSDFSIGSSVRFMCYEDYLMYGLEEQYCTEDGSWSGHGAPVCKDYRHPAGEAESVHIFTSALSQMPKRRQYSLSRTIDVNDDFDMQQIFFVIDVSQSVSIFDLKDEISFAIALVERLKEFRKSLQYAIMIFASSPKMVLSFTDDDSTSDDKAIGKLGEIVKIITDKQKKLRETVKQGTATAKALETLEDEIGISREQNPRRHTKTHIFLFTDGMHTSGRDPVRLRRDIELEFWPSIEFYSITAYSGGDSSAMKELKGLSSANGRNFIHIKDYYRLSEYLEQVTNLEIDYSECGKNIDVGDDKYKTSLGRTYGGTVSSRTAWPWQAAIIDRSGSQTNLQEAINDGSLVGGGSVINENWILTAVHVLNSNENTTGQYFIFLGFFPRQRRPRQPTVDVTKLPLQGFDIETYSLHPEFNWNTYNNDIALIKVGRAIDSNFNLINSGTGGITFNLYVRPICLPCTGTCLTENVLKAIESSDNAEIPRCQREENVLRAADEKAIVTGYGHSSSEETNSYRTTEHTSVRLRQVLLQIGNDSMCASNVGDVKAGIIYNENNICTAPTLNSKHVDACQGDSGGPMVREIRNTANSKRTCWVQIGIVSFGKGCGTGKYPGYFTNVMQYIPWINETIGYTLRGP